jgi:hypothetical protein
VLLRVAFTHIFPGADGIQHTFRTPFSGLSTLF